jgi:hypothetical protein
VAGQIVVSSIKTDSDNSISFLANTGATIFSANISNGISGNFIGAGSITGVKIAANTITGDDLGQNSVSANNIATNAIENYTALTNRPLSNRNIIINGAMQIVQRNANTTAITTDGYYSPDRWNINISSSGTWTMNVDSAGVNRVGPDEFSNSCNLICTTADSSLSAGDFLVFQQRFEGLNVQQIEKGTPAAESVTVSWYAKSSNTGTYICELFDNDNTRQCSKSWTINAANTWEKKSVTFPADATGRLDNDNLLSFILNFWLAAGTTWTSGTLNTTWASTTSANRAVGQFNLAGNINNYMAITGVQMELGSVATPFERRPFGTELSLCQRYLFVVKGSENSDAYVRFVEGNNETTTTFTSGYTLPVRMRATPTLTTTGTASNYGVYHAQTVTACSVAPSIGSGNPQTVCVVEIKHYTGA